MAFSASFRRRPSGDLLLGSFLKRVDFRERPCYNSHISLQQAP